MLKQYRQLYNKKDRFLLFGAMLFGGISAAISAFLSLILQQIVDVAVNKDIAGFSRLFTTMLLYLAILGIIGFLEAYLGKRLIRNVTKNLREGLFRGIFHKNPVSFHSQNSADHLSAIINDTKLIEENYLIPLLLTSQMVILFLTTLGILFYLSPAVTIVLLLFLILMFLIPALLGKKMQQKQDAYSDALAKFTSCTKDYLNGYDVIRSYNIFTYIFSKYRKTNKETADKKLSADTLLAVNECFSDLLSALSVVAIIFLASWLLLKGDITMGTLLALVQLSSTFVTPVVLLMQNLPKITSMTPVIQRLLELKGNDSDHSDSLPTSMESDGTPFASCTRPDFHQALSCREVTFGYEDGRCVLDHLNLTIKARGKYALLGDSGCGKSTLIKLLTGYTREFKGDITYDNHSVKEIPLHELTRLTAVIHQNVFLFDTDILDNICLGEAYSEAELKKALDDSGVSQFLPALDQGIHTPVGENGQYLSGGQRQRIAVARALIRRTPILILDEGTSAVDKQTAYDIERCLLEKQDLTVISITHHLHESLRQHYDEILRLENGQISV